MVLFITLYKLVLRAYCMTIQMKATEQHFPVALFIKLFKVILLSKIEFEILS